MNVIEVEDLVVRYRVLGGEVDAVKGVSFNVRDGESVCVIGESGSGKSTVAHALLGSLPPNARVEGRAYVGGVDVLRAPRAELDKLRGSFYTAIFQDPSSSFCPFFTVEEHLGDVIRERYGTVDPREARSMMVKALSDLKISDPERVLRSYPHELSGGMLQRVAIAAAMLLKPKVLIADEPTSNLDVTTQLYILKLLRGLLDSGMSLLLITHHIGVATYLCSKTLVMFSGLIVEEAPTTYLVTRQMHPYTQQLFRSIPRVSTRLVPSTPTLARKGSSSGCPYAHRCEFAREDCFKRSPDLLQVGDRRVRCLLYE